MLPLRFNHFNGSFQLEWEKPLIQGILIKRYKRFLADVLIDGKEQTVHVPNTGSMTSCWSPQSPCAVSLSLNPNRKMPYTLELTHNGETWIGVNTANANKLVKEWLHLQKISELQGYTVIQPEKKISDSRIDFYLEGHPEHPPAYVEVKSVTLKLDEVAQFPDAVTDRGQKHLVELMELKKKGFRSVMLYIVQREDVDLMTPAHSIDKRYGELLSEAILCGVEVLVYQCQLGLSGIDLKKRIPFKLE